MPGPSQTQGNPYGASAEAFSEGPLQNQTPALSVHPDPLCDQDGDEAADYIDHSAFSDTIG